MKFAETELRQIAEDTWKIVLDAELEPSAKSFAPADIDDCIAATAQIAGDWQLAVVIYGSAAMARQAATVMFGTAQEDDAPEDMQDAMCELVNIVAGNIKGVLSGSSHLSLPSLIRGNDFKLTFPRHILLSEAAFKYLGEPVVVSLLGEDKLAARLERGNGAAAHNP
jgi:CheY-specific phosphatase CheX